MSSEKQPASRVPAGSEPVPEAVSVEASKEAKTSGAWDWLLPSLSGLVIARLFGLVGGLAAVGVYFWLKPKLGRWTAIGAAALIGVVIAAGFAAMVARR